MINRRKMIGLLLVFVFLLAACGQTESVTVDTDEAVIEEAAVPATPEEEVIEIKEPYFVLWNCEDENVPADSEVVLIYAWMTTTEEQMGDYFNATQHIVSVNGIPTSIKSDWYGEIEETDDGYYQQTYWMNIGELDPGSYEIITVAEITEPVYDGWDWYGPDSSYPLFENFCSITVEGEALSPADQKVDSPAENYSCDISNSIHSDWDTYLCETFESDTILWTGNEEGTTARVENGQYVLDNSTQVSQGYTTGYIFPVTAGAGQTYIFSVDGSTESIYKSTAWGVFVRSYQDEIVYFFMINNEGRYMLTGSSEQEERRYLGNIKEGGSSAIVWDEVNNITAVVDGTQMEFYINGELATTHEANDDAFGLNFGLIVWGGEGVNAMNRFDNLLVRTKN